MAGAKEVRTQIASIKNTQKITSAMEMVAASKMRRAQERQAATEPYTRKMLHVIHHLAHAHPEYESVFMRSREVKNIGYIVVSSDRGLCGGLNNNLFRKLLKEVVEHQENGIGVKFCTIGSKAMSFFKRSGGSVLAEISDIGDTPHIDKLIGAVKVMLDAYRQGEVDQVYLATNKFINTMTQDPRIYQLVPIGGDTDSKLKHHWDYIYEPDARDVLEDLMARYIEAGVYQGVVENAACEQSARMVAMKAASDNAGDLIDELQLIYNKARQTAITQEISEIVGGAAAISG